MKSFVNSLNKGRDGKACAAWMHHFPKLMLLLSVAFFAFSGAAIADNTLPPTIVTANAPPVFGDYGFSGGGLWGGYGGYGPIEFGPGGGGSRHTPANKISAATAAQNPNPCPDNKQGDPIIPSGGNKVEDITDFAMPGEMGLKFERFYNSGYPISQSYYMENPTYSGVWMTGIDFHLFGTICLSNAPDVGNCSPVRFQRPDGSFLVFPSGPTIAVPPHGQTTQMAGPFVSNYAGTATLSYNSGNNTYVLHDEDSHILTFDNSGNLLSVVDLSNVGWTITHPNANTIVVTHTNGQSFTLAMVSGSATTEQQWTLTDPGNNVYTYTTAGQSASTGFGSIGRIDSVAYPGSPSASVSYKYTSLSSTMVDLLNEVDYNGVAHDYTGYDSTGRANMSKMADGSQDTSITYSSNSTGPVAAVTNALGQVTTFQYNARSLLGSVSGSASAHCTASYAISSYDANGNMASSTDNDGNVTNYQYAANGQLQQTVEAAGTSYSRTTNYTWDSTPGTDRLLSVTVAGDLETNYTYNSHGGLQSVQQTNLTSNGVAQQSRTTTYNSTYYANGMLASVTVTPPLASNTMTYTYNTLGSLSSVKNGLGQTTTYNTYDALGRVMRQTDPNGVITDYTYYPTEWLHTKTVRANANGSPSSSDATTTILYENLPVQTIASVTDADSVTTQFAYDAYQRLTKVTDAIGNSIQYTLDADGNRTGEKTYNTSGQVTKIISRQFNAIDQLVTVYNAAGYTEASYSYDPNGNVSDVFDANNVDTHYVYDPLGRRQQAIQNYQGSNSATANTTTTYSYDTLGHLTGVTDPSNLSTTYTVDGFGQVWTLNSPDTGQTSYTYNASGQLAGKTDARGVVTNYAYDAINRQTGVTFPAHPALNITYAYDQANPISSCPTNDNIGHVTGMTDASGTTAWCYTPQGDIREIQQVIGSKLYWSGMVYSLARRTAWVQYPSGFDLQYTRDADGRPTSINYRQEVYASGSWSTVGSVYPLISAVTYEPFGPMTSYTWAQTGNPSETFTYNGNYWPTAIAGGPLNLNFGYDGQGLITSSVSAQGGESYQYDELHRLIEANGPSGALEDKYWYNGTGDRTQQQVPSQSSTSNSSGTSGPSSNGSNTVSGGPAPIVNSGFIGYSYDSGTHHLGGRSYDAAGNTTELFDPIGTLVALAYDDRDVLTAVTNASSGAAIANYQYNGFGARVWKTASSPSSVQQATVYDPSGSGATFGEYIPGNSYRELVYLNGTPVASATNTGPQTPPVINDLYADHLGTIRAVTDVSGNSVYSWPWLNNAFGIQATTGSATFDNRFPGQNNDAETGLNYNGARYYDPTSGRYIQSDPIGLLGGMSTYAYVGGNPLTNFDPYGLWDWPALPQWSVNGAAGLGDGVFSAITFGYGNLSDVRDLLGSNEVVDRCSSAYNISSELGNGVGTIALSGAGFAKVAQIANVRSTAQAALLGFQLMGGASDLTGYMTEGASMTDQLSALVEMQQESALEESLRLTK